jgi:hypothetical protein
MQCAAYVEFSVLQTTLCTILLLARTYLPTCLLLLLLLLLPSIFVLFVCTRACEAQQQLTNNKQQATYRLIDCLLLQAGPIDHIFCN